MHGNGSYAISCTFNHKLAYYRTLPCYFRHVEPSKPKSLLAYFILFLNFQNLFHNISFRPIFEDASFWSFLLPKICQLGNGIRHINSHLSDLSMHAVGWYNLNQTQIHKWIISCIILYLQPNSFETPPNLPIDPTITLTTRASLSLSLGSTLAAATVPLLAGYSWRGRERETYAFFL
jgi:hypothetical protein